MRTVNYQEVLEDLRHKRNMIDQAIAIIEGMGMVSSNSPLITSKIDIEVKRAYIKKKERKEFSIPNDVDIEEYKLFNKMKKDITNYKRMHKIPPVIQKELDAFEGLRFAKMSWDERRRFKEAYLRLRKELKIDDKYARKAVKQEIEEDFNVQNNEMSEA